jgi:hypothetical protein
MLIGNAHVPGGSLLVVRYDCGMSHGVMQIPWVLYANANAISAHAPGALACVVGY